MHGWFIDCLEKLVIARYSAEIWTKVKEVSGCQVETGKWIRLQHYPDELCFKLFEAATEILGTNSLALFGQYFGRNYLIEHGYQNVLRCKNRSLKEWLNSINDMHDNFKSRLPEFVSPEFSCVDDLDDENEEAIILHYFSYRGPLLSPVVVGMVTEVAQNSFNMNIKMEQIATQDVNDSKFTSWRITLLSFHNPLLANSQVSLLRQTSKKKSKGETVKEPNVTTSTSKEKDKDKVVRLHTYVRRTSRSAGKCPFSGLSEQEMENNNSKYGQDRAVTSNGDNSSLDQFPKGLFHGNTESQMLTPPMPPNFSSKQIREIFPFHIAVDSNFVVVQEGNKLSPYLRGVSCVGHHISSVFQLKYPRCQWDWTDIALHIDEAFELKVVNNSYVADMLTAHSRGQQMGGPSRPDSSADFLRSSGFKASGLRSSNASSDDDDVGPNDRKTKITYRHLHHLLLKGGIYICDPESDPEITHFTAFFLVSPKVHNMTEMLYHNVTLPDFPRHSYQREFAILGDHLLSETNIALKLDRLNKQLDKELLGALQESEAEKLIAQQRAEILLTLPVHSAILDRLPEEEVIEMIDKHPDTLFMKDYDNKTAFDLCLESESYFSAVLKIVRDRLPVDPISREAVSPEKHGYVWTKVIQSVKYATIVKAAIDEFIHISHELAKASDEEGRPAMYIASPLCQRHIKEAMYFYRRYEIITMDSPHHKSNSCLLHIAIDHSDNDQRVALKFMAVKEHYNIEQTLRQKYDFNEDFIVPILRAHDSDTDTAFSQEVQRRGFTQYPYCIVMPAAERNLQTIISAERIAGRDWALIKHITTQVAQALKHVHGKGIMHGDVKPLNIMRCDGRMKLIDLDASAPLGVGFSGGKSSSAYVPPELVHCVDSGASIHEAHLHGHLMHVGSVKAVIKSTPTITAVTNKSLAHNLPFSVSTSDKDLGYEFVPARYSHDVWSLGCILYELCGGMKLFLQDDEDNIDAESMIDLYHFTDDFKSRKLSKITDLVARNLVSQLLMKDPKKRPNFDQIIAHPFLSGQKVSRMVGESAEFDVFLSYRVRSDVDRVSLLYDKLTASGLHVWWDKKCLLPGVPWEIGFTDGLLKSRIFVPVFSRGAVHHPTERIQNFSLLQTDSDVDNFLLELQLALEFQVRDLIEKIYPVMIGDMDITKESSSLPLDQAVFSNYFKTGCHPKSSDVVVLSVDKATRGHLERLCLGSPLLEDMTAAVIVKDIVKNQGHVVDGVLSTAFTKVQEDIYKMKLQLVQHERQQQNRSQHIPPSEPPIKQQPIAVSEHRIESKSSAKSTKASLASVVVALSERNESSKNSIAPLAGNLSHHLIGSPSSSVCSPSSVQDSISPTYSSRIPPQCPFGRGSAKLPSNLSPLRTRPQQLLPPPIPPQQNPSNAYDEAHLEEMISFLHGTGLAKQKSKQYALKLNNQHSLESPKMLIRIHENAKLLNILHHVMDRNDADLVYKDVCRLRKIDKRTRHRSPDRMVHNPYNLAVLPSISDRSNPKLC